MPDASAPSPLLAFVDTPIFLECGEVATLDFKGHLGEDLVHVVVTPLVVDQIERFKDQPRKGIGEAKRKRAQARLVAIERHLFPAPEPATPEPVHLAEGLHLAWWDDLDDAVFQGARLAAAIEDHLLVGYALTARERGHRVVLVTPDVGARLTAKARGLAAYGLPPEWTEPAGKTEEEQGTSDAIGRASAAPYTKLALVFDTPAKKSCELAIAAPPEVDVDAFAFLGPEHFVPEGDDRPLTKMSAAMQVMLSLRAMEVGMGRMPSDEEVARYDKALPAYYSKLAKAVDAALERHLLIDRHLLLPLSIVNEGSTPADEVEVVLDLDREDMRFATELPEPAPIPEPPRRPRLHSEIMDDVLRGSVSLRSTLAALERGPNARAPSWVILPGARRATIEVPKVQHRRGPLPLPPLYVVLGAAADATKPATFSFVIHSRQGSQPAPGKLTAFLRPGAAARPFDFPERVATLAREHRRKRRDSAEDDGIQDVGEADPGE